MKIPKTDYLFMNISAVRLVQRLKRKSFKITSSIGKEIERELFYFDFNNLSDNAFVILSSESREYNGLFYQLESLYKEEKYKDNFADSKRLINVSNNTSIDSALVYVDFDGFFRKKEIASTLEAPVNSKGQAYADGFAEEFICNGFCIVYDNDKYVHYVPFDRSSSMAKDNKCTFIDRRIYDDINNRLLLDLPFTKLTQNSGIELSKYYAYKGLYMTSGMQVLHDKLIFDASTFIVLNDRSYNINHPVELISAKQDEDKPNNYIKEELCHDSDQIDALFDGEGLISPTYAAYINEVLSESATSDNSTSSTNEEADFDNEEESIGINNSYNATSFQIRMPFTKGMLHQVDFNAFINDFTKTNTDDSPLYITDYFGIKRDIRKAQIIVTNTMFKAAKWFKNFSETEMIKKKYNEIFPSDTSTKIDPMKYFFHFFNKYGHKIFIANTNVGLGNKKCAPLNYQIFSTLDISLEEIEQMVNAHFNQILDPLDYLNLKNNTSCDTSSLSSWEKALKINNTLVNEPYIKNKISNIQKSLVMDIGKGRILVDGEGRYLSSDLLFFLIYLLEKINTYLLEKNENSDYSVKFIMTDDIALKDDPAKYNNKDVIKNLWKKTIKSDHCYISKPHIKDKSVLSKDLPVAVFRNPHLSRNEECALSPFRNNLYTKYMSQLDGVIMLAKDSLAARTLGGADYDGDEVKIIYDDTIREAVVNGVYKKENIKDKTVYKRILPIIQIPSPSPTAKAVPLYDENDFYITMKNTFSSDVGRISNNALKIAQVQYNDNFKNAKLKYTAEFCTILVGLEIDAAKSGKHPNLEPLYRFCEHDKKDSAMLLSENNINSETGEYIYLPLIFDYKRDFEDKLSLMKKKKYFINPKGSSTKFTVKYFSNEEFISYDYNKIISFKEDDAKDESITTLSLLPKLYFEKYSQLSSLENDYKDCKDFFTFPITKAKTILKTDDKLKESVNSVYIPHKQILSIHRSTNNFVSDLLNSKEQGHVVNLMRIQYDAENADEYNTILENFNEYLDSHFACYEDLISSINRLAESNWEFLHNSQKEAKLYNILNICDSDKKPDSDFIQIITNYYSQGYFLLYYCLLAYRARFARQTPFIDLAKYIGKEDYNEDIEKNIYCKLYKKLISVRTTQTYLNQIISAECKDKLDKLFDNNSLDRRDILSILYTISDNKSSNDFFWNNITDEDIDNYVIPFSGNVTYSLVQKEKKEKQK